MYNYTKSTAKEGKAMTTAKSKTKVITADIALIAMFTALTAVCSWVSIPVGEVPVTLQTFAIFMTVGILGTKRGVISVLVYILLGAAGVPVFAGFSGGIGSLIGTTGGYIIGFIFSAALAGVIIDKFGSKLYIKIAAMLAGLVVCYAFGTAWFIIFYTRSVGAIGIGAALMMCVVPFIIPDVLKIVAAACLSTSIKKALDKVSHD